MKLFAVLAPLAFLSMAFAGCTGSSDNGGTVPEQDSEGRYIIRMTSSNTFHPADAEVPVGSTVVWMLDGGAHNVAPDGHSQWSATTVTGERGEHLEVTFDTKGTFKFYCSPHQSLGMKGTITVV